jgi:protein TonB
MSFVVAMHAALLVLLARSFGVSPPALFTGSEQVIIDEPIAPEDPLPRVADPEIVNQDINLVPPVDPIPLEETTDPPPQPPTQATENIQGAGSAVPMPVIHNARPDPRRPLTQPAYSQSDIREGNEGAVDLEVYVLADGRVGDARIVRSSGFERMDQATLEEARRRWRLIPATRDGTPFAQWYRLRVKFELRN